MVLGVVDVEVVVVVVLVVVVVIVAASVVGGWVVCALSSLLVVVSSIAFCFFLNRLRARFNIAATFVFLSASSLALLS